MTLLPRYWVCRVKLCYLEIKGFWAEYGEKVTFVVNESTWEGRKFVTLAVYDIAILTYASISSREMFAVRGYTR